ncbi:uncharacterized protein [Watersipora subatra]|uniref:uncharacterized protein n=1 Tax=Watersipora subatra TaxID=2589382 RepID=UPI00355B3E47
MAKLEEFSLVPSDSLIPKWTLCMNTLSLYLMHPASTVRQATSKVIKFIVARDTSNPAILKLVLNSLSCHWSVNADLLSQDCLPENYSHLPESTQLYLNANESKNVSITSLLSHNPSADIILNSQVSKTWEWREGRLLAYELIFQFLVKNHWLYTFGVYTRNAHSCGDEYKR